MAIASRLGPIDKDVSSSEDKKQDEKLEGKATSTIVVPFVEEGVRDALEEDSNDAPIVHFTIQKRKVRAYDSDDPDPIHVLPT